jgi:hypothetical protein
MERPMLRVFRVPVADDHPRATHGDIVELRTAYTVEHLVEIYDVAVVALFDIHFVETPETNHAILDAIFRENVFATHTIGIVYAA